VLLVKKKDGSWRFYVDYHHLNAITVKGKYSVPVIDETLYELASTSWFSKLDLRAGFHQIRLHAGEEYCRRFDPGGSLDRRVNCRRVSQPRWVGTRRNTKGGETAKGKPAAFVLSCVQVGCACSRGLQASTRESEGERERLSASPFSRAANLLI
jgi:hypothetical protein